MRGFVGRCKSWSQRSALFRRTWFLTCLEQLAECIDAGLNLTNSIQLLVTRSDGKKRELLRRMLYQIENGLSVADVIGTHMDSISASMLKMAEQVGLFSEAIHIYTVREKKQLERREEWVKSFSYPVGLLIGCIALVLFVRLQVQPELHALTESFHSDGPNGNWSERVANQIPLIVAGLLIFLPTMYGMTQIARKYTGRTIIGLPLDRLLMEVKTEHFVHALSIQLSAGLSLVDALQIGKMSGSTRTNHLYEYTYTYVLNGQLFSDALHPQLCPELREIIQIGEMTGEVERSLQQAAHIFEKSIARRLKRITRSIEPVLMGTMGLVVLSTMYSVFSPMYSAVSSVSGIS